ncbi:LamG-like jellyroll fold domain-containing protein [Geofilum rubicundum]|uniref:LamG-like jellyroll fold domain-containing protein n=1 Tax=Geofilum rubicundum JCM 15548 TaxID=1236989 RepID=A0A0E9LWC5_9BACT|nr:LamG-like jellyroll fold domain-containing protein [Geofilum rubicundum]GAO29613.1 hypothetical protein JCM15548_11820 [Geofilum rubicundum JCM 15548]
MKTFHIFLTIIALLTATFTACNDGIDDISPVDAGPDESAPTVDISYPAEGAQIMVTEAVTSITIKFEVEDDIEIGEIKVTLDGTEIATYNTFKDYRRFVGSLLYEELSNGEHTLVVSAEDTEGKTSSATVHFMKVPPYEAKYDGEVFYMAFNGDYMELISQTDATIVGEPGFSANGISGKAYAGATDSYITFPMDDLKGNTFSAAFWYKPNAEPNRAGLLSVSPEGEDRTKGLRFFREGSATEQRFKLNLGTGDGEVWNDGGVVDVTANQWVHLAFSISETECIIYINGEATLTALMADVIDWTGTTNISIGSGAPNFAYWDHKSDLSLFDELRIFNKALSQEEVQTVMADEGQPVTYEAKYDGETFYMPFDGNYKELISETEAAMVGTPDFAGLAKLGSDAYAGATDAYITFPSAGLTGDAFSAAMWYKANPDPDRAGIISISPEGEDRTKGLRFFREGSATEQRFKLNLGTGDAEVWNDGGVITLPAEEWVHLAFTVSATECIIYINGVETLASETGAAIDWTGTDAISIGSGRPTLPIGIINRI